MVHRDILRHDEIAIKTIVMSYEINQVVRNIAGPSSYYWDRVPMAKEIMGVICGDDFAQEEMEAIFNSLPEMSDEDVLWLDKVVGQSYARFIIVGYILDNRKHLINSR